MKLKLKEGVDLKSLIVQHSIAMTAIELLDLDNIHLDSEIKLEVMISVCNYLTGGQVLKEMEKLEKRELLDFINNSVEPIYETIKDEYADILNYLFIEVKDYIIRKNNYDNSIGGVVNTIFGLLQNMTSEDVETFKNLATNLDAGKKEQYIDKRLKKIEDNINNTKLKELIQQYQKQND